MGLDQNTNILHFLTTVVCIFSKYVYCDMQFLDVKIGALFYFLNGSGIYLLEIYNSVINCIIIETECGQPNATKLSNFMNYS